MPNPSRLSEFQSLFARFVVEFLEAEIGRQHRELLQKASRTAQENYERVERKVEADEDFTDDLLRSFLPHGECTFVEQSGAWRHFAPTLNGSVQAKFEGSGWTRPEDWPKVAASIFRLVRIGIEEPTNFPEECRSFSELSWTKGLQAAYLSPILSSLRPDLYSVANHKPRRVAAWLFDEKMEHRNEIARYPAFNQDLRDGIDELAEIIDPHVPDGLDRYQTFDFFTHWMTSIERYFDQPAATTTNKIRTILPDPAERRELLPLFADAIERAATANNRVWHVIARKWKERSFHDQPLSQTRLQIALTVGVLHAAKLNAMGLVVVVEQQSLTDSMQATLEEAGSHPYPWLAGSYPEPLYQVAITPDLADFYRTEVRPLHFAFIERAATLRDRNPYRQFHHRDVVAMINAELDCDLPQPEYVYDTTNAESRNYWWINASPAHWDLAKLPVGEEHFYTAYNEQGNKRQRYRHMQALKVGDLVVGYESSPRRHVSAILEITKPLTPIGGNEQFSFRKIIEITEPIEFRQMQQHEDLADAEPIVNNQGSLFALTDDEFLTISEMGNVDLDRVELEVSDDERQQPVRQLIEKTEADPRARESFEARKKSEAEARSLLEQNVGSMTEADIRHLLGRLTLGRIDEKGREISARFGVALIGHSANQIASDPEAFNHWTALLWKSEPEEAIEHLGTMVRQKKVKGGGISLASAILYLRDPERFGIGLGMMTRYLREFGYDPPAKLQTAADYRGYLKELHRFRDDHDIDPRHLDYVIWDVGAKMDDGPETSDPVTPQPTLEAIADETNVDLSTLESWLAAIDRKGQAIFYGPPGTGKTFVAEKLARYLASRADGIVQTIQFHPAYGYEDFIAGIRPVTDEETNELRYENVPGAFVRFCKEAATKGEESRCVMVIDEINRADLARVFGELMHLLEYREKEIRLAGGTSLSIPENVRIIGTMNTADRSIALVDHALRRRFAFLELRPDYDLLVRYHKRLTNSFDPGPLIALLQRVNEAIGDPHYAVGISYFLDRQIDALLPQIWQTEIEPYLAEHFFDRPQVIEEFRWTKVGSVVLDTSSNQSETDPHE